MSLRRGSDIAVFAVVRTFLVASFFVRGSIEALDFGGNVNYRAPSSCPPLPSHCRTRTPWACMPKTSCSIDKPVCSNIDRNSSINAVNLTKNVFYYTGDSTRCLQALNLTWIARPKDYAGFLIKMTYSIPARNVFDYEEKPPKRFVIDKNKPGFGNGTEPMLFYYDCQKLGIAASYRFELYGLRNSRSSCLRQNLIGAVTFATNCDTYPEADPRIKKWTPFVNVVLSDGNSTMKIYFTPAPRSFQFSSYHILLLDSRTQRLLGNASGLPFTCTSYHAVVFKQVCSGNYSIQIFAFRESSQRCNDCGIEKIVSVTGSEYSCPSKVLLESPSFFENSTLSALSSLAGSTLRNSSSGESEKTKIIVGGIVLLALFIGVTVTVVMLSRICKGVNRMPGKNPSVLLIYAKDNKYHCNVVQRFASYLQQHCYCEVKLDLWCSDEISKISALDWLLLQIQSAGNIVVVNSEGGWRQYEGRARNVAFERIRSETPLEDMFLLAVKELKSNKRVFKVAFPYTHSRYFIGDAVRGGKTYSLMNDIEDLFLGIQQLSKHSGRGKKLASDINASSYTKCKEGKSLAAAFKEAGEFLQANPEWFSEFYTEKNPSLEDCHPSPVFDSGFEPSTENLSSTSDRYEMPMDDEMHGLAFYPPSDLDDNDSSVSSSNIEERFALVNNEYEETMTN